jgi:hypothetical protein
MSDIKTLLSRLYNQIKKKKKLRYYRISHALVQQLSAQGRIKLISKKSKKGKVLWYLVPSYSSCTSDDVCSRCGLREGCVGRNK